MSVAALCSIGSGIRIIDPVEALDSALASYRERVLEHERVKTTTGAWPSDLARARCEEVEARLEVKRVLWANTSDVKVRRPGLEATGERLQ